MNRPEIAQSLLPFEAVIPPLWDHQETVHNTADYYLKSGTDVVICGETGFGKTRVAKVAFGRFKEAHLAAKRKREVDQRTSGKALFVVYGRSMVDNASHSFSEDPVLQHGLLMSGEPTRATEIQVGSIDSVLSWYCRDGRYDSDWTYDYIIVDEVHMHLSKVKTLLEAHNRKRAELGLFKPYVLGLSATPQTKGLGSVFADIVYGPAPTWLQDHGYAAHFEYLAGSTCRVEELKIHDRGEYSEASHKAAFDRMEGDMIRDYMEHLYPRKVATISFFRTLEMAAHAHDMYQSYGVKSAFVHGKTPRKERDIIFQGLNEGHLDVGCNVGVIERGIDIRRVGGIQLCLAIAKLKRYRQMIGRGSRLQTAENALLFPNAQRCLVVDHGGNVARHKYWENEVRWSLDDHHADPIVIDNLQMALCPVCGKESRSVGICQACQSELPETPIRNSIVQYDRKQLEHIDPRRAIGETRIRTDGDIMSSAIMIGLANNLRFDECVAAANSIAESHGIRDFQVPPEVMGRQVTHDMLERRVSTIW